MKHSVYLPPEYSKDESRSWPLILFLHGAGEKGDDEKLLKSTGLPNILETMDIPFIVISPQCPREKMVWPLDDLDLLLERCLKKFRADRERVYLTGISMGGFATWQMALEYPYRFAAIAPICGGGASSHAKKIKHLPIWVFHGADDKIVSPEYSRIMVRALELYGGNVRFTLYPETGHDCWTRTYKNREIYRWFLNQKRGKVSETGNKNY
jgi:predicted peptidase